MSEEMNRGARDFSKYDSMTTEELDEILRFDPMLPDDEEPDVELLLYVLEVRANRRKQLNNDDTGNEALEAWKSFEQNYLPQAEKEDVPQSAAEKPKILPLRWMRGAVAAIIVVVFLTFGSITASAFGFDLWKIVATWASETFYLASYGQAQLDEPKANDQRQYTTLQDALREHNCDPNIVPTWIPDGYELVELEFLENPLRKKYLGIYESGEKVLKISVSSYLESNPELMEQSEGYDDIYESGGILYYIFTDISQVRAIWVNGSYECYISGELTIEEIKEMINSITER